MRKRMDRRKGDVTSPACRYHARPLGKTKPIEAPHAPKTRLATYAFGPQT